MMTIPEVEASLKAQIKRHEVLIKRHEVLMKIIELITDLRKTDEEGADWVTEQVAE